MNASIVKLFNELKSEIQSLRAEIAALKAEKSPVKNVLPSASETRQERILRLPEVLKLIGLARSSLYLKIKQGVFPKQIKLGERASGWFESDIVRFMDSLRGAV